MYLRLARDRLFDRELHALALLHGGAGRAPSLDEHVPFVELRQELLAERRECERGQNDGRDSAADRDLRATHRGIADPARNAISATSTIALSFSSILPTRKAAMAAGTKVSERTKAQASAMITVNAIGSNILPSTPEKVSSGT